MKQSWLTLAFLVALLVVTLGVALAIFQVFLQPVAFAAILGVGLYPLHARMQRWVRGRSGAALLSTLVVLLLFVLPAGFVAAAVSSEMATAGRYLAERSREAGGVGQLASDALHVPMDRVGRHIDLQKTGIQAWVESLPARASGALVTSGALLVRDLAGFAGQTVITFFILFFLFRDGPALVDRIASLMPLREDQINQLFVRIRDSIIANLYGILAVGIVQGLLTGLALWLLRVPSPLMLGVLAGFSSLIPLLGTSLVWVPAGIYLIAAAHAWKGVALLLWGALVVSSSDNVVRPLIVQGRVAIHPLLLLFAMFGGLNVFGFLGIFIGPIVLSLAFALFDMLREEVHRHRAESATLGSS